MIPFVPSIGIEPRGRQVVVSFSLILFDRTKAARPATRRVYHYEVPFEAALDAKAWEEIIRKAYTRSVNDAVTLGFRLPWGVDSPENVLKEYQEFYGNDQVIV